MIGVPAHTQDKTAGAFNTTKLFMGQFLDPFVDLFAWGIFERHPKLKLVMAASGVGWLPWIVQSWTIDSGDCGRPATTGTSAAST